MTSSSALLSSILYSNHLHMEKMESEIGKRKRNEEASEKLPSPGELLSLCFRETTDTATFLPSSPPTKLQRNLPLPNSKNSAFSPFLPYSSSQKRPEIPHFDSSNHLVSAGGFAKTFPRPPALHAPAAPPLLSPLRTVLPELSSSSPPVLEHTGALVAQGGREEAPFSFGTSYTSLPSLGERNAITSLAHARRVSSDVQSSLTAPFPTHTIKDMARALVYTKLRERQEWNDEEEAAFLKGLKQHGKDFFALMKLLPHRSRSQIRTHYRYLAKSNRYVLGTHRESGVSQELLSLRRLVHTIELNSPDKE